MISAEQQRMIPKQGEKRGKKNWGTILSGGRKVSGKGSNGGGGLFSRKKTKGEKKKKKIASYQKKVERGPAGTTTKS